LPPCDRQTRQTSVADLALRWSGLSVRSARDDPQSCRESARRGLCVVGHLAARNEPRMWPQQSEGSYCKIKNFALQVPYRYVPTGELIVKDKQPRSTKMATLLRTLFAREESRSDMVLPAFPDFCRGRHSHVANTQPHECLRPIPMQQPQEAVTVHAAPPLRCRVAAQLWTSPSAV
jgi:hypothetical protein